MNTLLRQLAKFAAVGGGATVVHVTSALVFHSYVGIAPLTANFYAFLVASAVSYWGNWLWTFDKASHHHFSAPRFAAVSLTCFSVNQLIVYGVVNLLRQPLWVAMFPVVIFIPLLGFWLSKTRVFLPRSVP